MRGEEMLFAQYGERLDDAAGQGPREGRRERSFRRGKPGRAAALAIERFVTRIERFATRAERARRAATGNVTWGKTRRSIRNRRSAW